MALVDGVRPTISGGGLTETYVLGGIHFHWGLDETLAHGAEHLVNSYRYPMEVRHDVTLSLVYDVNSYRYPMDLLLHST